jgi:hypothetical protein
MNKAIIILGASLLACTYVYCTIDQTTKKKDNMPAFYWNDRTAPPHNGFELKVDMYWNETKDTIYMEYSSGPEGE